MNTNKRVNAFVMLAKFTGLEVTSQFLRKTGEHYPQAGISIIHNLAEGIFKPADDQYAFSIWSRSASGMDREIYPDLFQTHENGSWTMMYSAKQGSLESAVNKSLFTCMKDHVPVLVIVTSQSGGYPGGARYKIIGPAIIENYDAASRRFMIRGCSDAVLNQVGNYKSPYETAIYALRNCLILPFQVGEPRSKYQVAQLERERAFRAIVLEEYKNQCAVCQSKFLLKQADEKDIIEAEAAHIIPVKKLGPDDPRNGLSLCRRHHWAFDSGLFTLTDSKAVQLSPAVVRAERRRFDLEEYEGQSLVGPSSDVCRPAEEALHWHQKKIFLRN